MSQSEVRLAVSGDVHGHVVIGDHNLVVSEGGSVLALLQSGERPVPSRRDHVELLPRRIPPPQGRDAELERLEQYVADSSTVQVYGPPGIGKTTLLRQAAHRLAERGTELAFLPAAGRTAGDLAQDVFEACYDAPGYRPTTQELQRLMAGVEVCVLMDDLEITDEERGLLLSAMRDATLLFSSVERSLWDEGRTLGLGGLAEQPGLALLARVLDRPLRQDEVSLARELLRAADGSPLLLVRAAAEAHRTTALADGQPVMLHAGALGELLPQILGRVSGTARDLASLLGYGGTPGIATEVLQHLVPDPGTLAADLAQLTDLALVLESEQGFRLAPGVPETLPPGSVDLAGLVTRLRDWAATRNLPPQAVAAHATLITAVIDATLEAGRPDLGARLAKAAAPAVACSLRLGAWERLLVRGKVAAARAGDNQILAYLCHEDGIRNLVSGKHLAAMAGISAALELWHQLGDTAHTALAQHTHALTAQAVPHATTAAHPAAATATSHTAHATTAHTTTAHTTAAHTTTAHTATHTTATHATAHATAHTGHALTGKAGIGLTAKLVIGGGVAAVAATGATVASVTLTSHSAAKPPPVVVPAATTPMLAYATPTAIEVRAGTGPARVLATLPAGNAVQQLVWSQDRKTIAWTAGSDVEIADVQGGPVRHWSCTCRGIVFRSNRLLSGDGDLSGGPYLTRYPAQGTATERVPLSGLPSTDGTLSTFNLEASLPSGELIVGYGVGVSSHGGPQRLYRVDQTGHAIPFGPAQDITANTPFSGFAADPGGTRLGFLSSMVSGACGAASVTLADTTTGRLTTPSLPSNGLSAEAVWFDAAGTAYAAFVGTPTALVDTPTACRNGSTTLVLRAEGNTWVSAGQGVLRAAYAKGGWQASLSGPAATTAQQYNTLTITHAKDRVTIPNAGTFAWSP